MNKPKCVIDSYSNKFWYLNGVYHCEDGPAIEYTNGSKRWYLNGILFCWIDKDSIFSMTDYNFAKGFVRWIEAIKELQGKK